MSNFSKCYKAIVTKATWFWHKIQYIDLWNIYFHIYIYKNKIGHLTLNIYRNQLKMYQRPKRKTRNYSFVRRKLEETLQDIGKRC